MLNLINSLKDLAMLASSEKDHHSDDEDIDGLIAAVLQDIETKEAMNEGPEGSATAPETQTNSNINQNDNNNNNHSNNNNNNNNNSNSNSNTHSNTHSNTQIQPQPQPLNKRDQNNQNNSHQMAPQLIFRESLSQQSLSRQSINSLSSRSTSNESNHAAMKLKKVTSFTFPVTAKQSLQNLKSCVKKIGHILSEVDEDKNGEIDYEEFQEGLRNIDSNLLPNEIEEIYQHFAWNDCDELNIKLFINLLFQRCKKIKTVKNTNISPKYILNIAFKSDVFRDKSPPPPSPSSLPTATNHIDDGHGDKLNKIYDILAEKDDDDNLFIDWNEFEEAMIDLGVKMSRNNLKIVYKILIKKQGNNNKELNIKQFMSPLSTLKCIESMEANQIIQQYFEPMIPIKKKIFNHPLRRGRKNSKKNGHRKNFSTFDHSHSSKNMRFQPKIKKKSKHNRYASLTNLANVSIMKKSNCSLIVLSALKKQLHEVDEDENNKIDYQEFKEVLLSLKSSITGIESYKIFYNLVERNEDELDVDKLVAAMKHCYKLYPNISGDECIEKISSRQRKKSKYASHNSSQSMSSTLSSTLSIVSMLDYGQNDHEEDEKHIKELKDRNVIDNISNICEIEEVINQYDADETGLIDEEQFIAMLAEWRIAKKFSKTEMNIIYNELVESESESELASTDLFMDKVHEIYRDHPNYSARKAVYRVSKKLIKSCTKQQ